MKARVRSNFQDIPRYQEGNKVLVLGVGTFATNVYRQQFSLINAHKHISGDKAFKRMKD